MSTPKPNRPQKPAAVKKVASALVPVIATVMDDSALKDIEKLATELRAKGMTVEQVMPLSGTIAGSCAVEAIPEINSKMRGAIVLEQSVDAYPSSASHPGGQVT